MNSELYNIYYIETNLICVLLLSFVLVAYLKEMREASESRYYTAEIIEIMVYCLSDMVAAVCKWESFPGVRIVLLLANAIYVAIPGIMVVTWGQYLFLRMKKYGFKKSPFDRVCIVLVMAGFLLTLSSPFTQFAFYLDENNLYHRNPGAYLVPILSYLYMIYDTIKLIVISRKTDSLEGRRTARTLSIFVVPCILCSLLQIFVYGCTVAQVGFALGFIMVYLINQQNKISKDDLTGLNNRREFENQFDNMSKNAEKLLVGMIDADSFKAINDNYGHVEGDKAIKSIARVLSSACGKCKSEGDFFLARYGGDEFVILSREFKEGANQKLSEAIRSELDLINDTKTYPYAMSLSVGIAYGNITCKKDASEIMKKADSEMYRVKRAKKKFYI